MASTYTGLGTELMTTGENAGTWGSTTNTNLQIIEQMVGGYVEKAVTSTPTTLSVSDGSAGAELAHRVIKFTGTISENTVVTIPLDVQQLYILVNGTSGAYTVQFKYASGSGSSVTFATTDKGTKFVYATADDGTNPNLVDTGISSTGAHDLDGNEFILDADADTSITADSDDQIDIKIAGADDFQFTANTFTAQSGSTIAAQALTATTVTASGIVKTDDTTEATSTTDGSLQTDGGLSVAKDVVLGDDVKLLSDSAVLSFGADSDTTLTHTDGTGLTLNSANKLLFRDSALSISSSTDGQLDIDADTEVEIATTTLDLNGALDVSGASQFSSTITVGENDTGYDVKFFGDTASAYMLWDTSADDLILAGGAGLVIPDAGNIGSASDTDAVAISSAGVVALSATTEASATGTAALTLAGGLGVAKDVWIGDDLVLDSDSTVLKFGDDQDTTLTHTDGTGLTLNGTNKLCFYDTALSISSSTDGQLDIDADTEVEIATTTLDLNAALDVSGASQFSSTVTVGENDTGYDVKFFGATSGAYGIYDESADALEIRGATAAGAGLLKLTTGELTVVDADKLGRIDFQAPVESDGTDSTAIAASIWAEADDTFSASVNNTDLVFALGKSEAAAEKFRFTADTEIGIAGANYGTDGQVLTSGGAGAACAWEDATGGSGAVSLSGSTNNTIATVTGANALIGEANLTFTGSALTCIGTVTVGVDGTGHDVTFYGDTASSYMLWDESADSLLLNAATLDLNGTADSLILDADGDTTISSPSDDQIDFEIAGADDFTMTANTFTILSGSTIAIAAGGAITNAGTMAPDITSTGKALVMGF